MTKLELERLLKKNGWKIVHGSKHDAAVRDDTGVKITIPRHKNDIRDKTLDSILKAAGLK